jgi:hypothetical protein
MRELDLREAIRVALEVPWERQAMVCVVLVEGGVEVRFVVGFVGCCSFFLSVFLVGRVGFVPLVFVGELEGCVVVRRFLFSI